jgi:hypothetical protein
MTGRYTSIADGWSIKFTYLKLPKLIIEWSSYFGLANIKMKFKELNEWIRQRIRMCYWKQ